MSRNALIQVRRDTSTNWATKNPVLAQGELGIETDTGVLKAGDGATAWTSLPDTGNNLITQQSTAQDAAGVGNDDFCLVIPNQITTGSAPDGVHDLVMLLRNNPSRGDADFYIARDTVNTSGVFFCHVPIRSNIGLPIVDGNGVTAILVGATDSTVKLAHNLVGNQGANKNLILQQGGASAVTRLYAHDGATSLLVIDDAGNVTSSPAGVAVVLQNTSELRLLMTSGNNGSVNSDSSNRVNIKGGSGGTRVLNNAGTASLTMSDAGTLTLNIAGQAISLPNTSSVNLSMVSGSPATINSDSSNRLNIAGGSGGTRFINNAFSATNVTISDAGVITYRNGTTHRDGSGSPETVVTAPVGSTYSRTDGGAGTSFYVKESGSGNTGWVGK